MTGSVDIDQSQAEIDRLKGGNEKLRTSNRHWMWIAGTDDLTGLPNKVFSTTALLPPLITQANPDSSSFVCIMVAPNRLGDINQKYSCEGGDQIHCYGAGQVLKGQPGVRREVGPYRWKEISEELLRRVGLALDEAKRKGGDKVVEDTESQEV